MESAQQGPKFARTKNQSVSMREEKDGSVVILGLREEKLDSREQLYMLLEQAGEKRSVGSTKMNDESSRSHAIFTLILEKSSLSDEKDFVSARLTFVDLAGSERLGRTEAIGKSMREGININKGLLALGNVISALTDDTGKVSYVPYRVSKLTRILRNSLGGNSRTWMIACVSPVLADLDESLNTIKYASRARKISNTPIINKDPQSAIIAQLKQQVSRMQAEMFRMKRQLVANGIPMNSVEEEVELDSGVWGLGFVDQNQTQGTPGGSDLEEKIRKMQTEMMKLNEEKNKAKKELNERNLLYWRVTQRVSELRQNNETLIKMLEQRETGVVEGPDIIESRDTRERSTAIMTKIIAEEASDELFSLNKELENLKQKLNEKTQYAIHIESEYTKLLKTSTRENEMLVEKIKECEELRIAGRFHSKAGAVGKSTGFSDRDQLDLTETTQIVDFPVWENADSSQVVVDQIVSDHEIEIYKVEKEKNEAELETLIQNLEEKETQLKNMQEKVELELIELQPSKQDIINMDRIIELETEKESLLKMLKEQTQASTSPGVLQNDKKGGEKEKSSNAMHGHHPKENPDSVNNKHKQKVLELEAKIAELRKKEKGGKDIDSKMKEKNSKIEDLQDQMQRIRNQKLELEKKVREASQSFAKAKLEKQKEIIGIKKDLYKKTAEVARLKNLSKKKDLTFQKKISELKKTSGGTIKSSKKTSKKINLSAFENIDNEGFSQIVQLICQSIYDHSNLQLEIENQTIALEKNHSKLDEILLEFSKSEVEKLHQSESKNETQDELGLLEEKQGEFQVSIASCESTFNIKRKYIQKLEEDLEQTSQFINEGFASLLDFLTNKTQDNSAYWETALNILMLELEKLKKKDLENIQQLKQNEISAAEMEKTTQELKKMNSRFDNEIDR